MVSSLDALAAYLRAQKGNGVTMTFAEIEQVTATPLPGEAQHSGAWWSNLARATGFDRVDVDPQARRAVFKRITGMADEAVEYKDGEVAPEKKPRRSPLFGCMKGTFEIDPAWDVTKPALEPEEWAEWEVSLDRKADLWFGPKR